MKSKNDKSHHVVLNEQLHKMVFSFVWNNDPIDINKIKKWIALGLDINSTDSNGGTVLQRLASKNNPDILKTFIDLGANINAKTPDRYTPLHDAAVSGALINCKVLLEHGALINEQTDDGETPLMVTCLYSRLEVIKIIEIVQLLLSYNANISVKDNDGNTILQRLIKEPAYPEKGLFDQLDEFGIQHFLTNKEQIQLVEFLIKNNIPINEKNDNGHTSLLVACYEDKTEIAELLIKYGTDLSIKDDYDTTPLMQAVEQKNYLLVKILLENGAAVNECDKNGWTALHFAVKLKALRIVELLLSYNANPDVKTNKPDCYTPLQIASLQNDKEMYQLLIQQGAYVYCK